MPFLGQLSLNDLTPSRLWSELDSATRTLAARSLYAHDWQGGSPPLEANRSIASTLRFREVAVRKLPVQKRVEYLARAVRPDDSLASSLLVALHLEQRAGMLAAFLDRLEIPHAGGLIDEDHELQPLEPESLASATDGLYEGFPETEVEVYLATLLAMDPDTWGGLIDIVRGRA